MSEEILNQNTGTLVVDPGRRMGKKVKESMSTECTGGARGRQIVLRPVPYGGRQPTLAKQVGQGMSGRGPRTENREGDILSEGRRTMRKKLILRYGTKSALLPITFQRAQEIGPQSQGSHIPLLRSTDRVLNACMVETQLPAKQSRHRSLDLR